MLLACCIALSRSSHLAPRWSLLVFRDALLSLSVRHRPRAFVSFVIYALLHRRETCKVQHARALSAPLVPQLSSPVLRCRCPMSSPLSSFPLFISSLVSCVPVLRFLNHVRLLCFFTSMVWRSCTALFHSTKLETMSTERRDAEICECTDARKYLQRWAHARAHARHVLKMSMVTFNVTSLCLAANGSVKRTTDLPLVVEIIISGRAIVAFLLLQITQGKPHLYLYLEQQNCGGSGSRTDEELQRLP